jgi:hypothetical protein
MTADTGERRPGVCIITSAGGHLLELRQYIPVLRDYDCHWVINHPVASTADLPGRVEFIPHRGRTVLTVLYLPTAWRILRTMRPAALLSCGASPAVPFAIVARVLGIPVVFIEPSAAVKRPTLTGRLIYRLRLSTVFYVNWPAMQTIYPGSKLAGAPHWSSSP